MGIGVGEGVGSSEITVMTLGSSVASSPSVGFATVSTASARMLESTYRPTPMTANTMTSNTISTIFMIFDIIYLFYMNRKHL